MRVLLVDDDARMRKVLAQLLHNAGFDAVDEAGDGQEALEKVAQLPVDLIVTDRDMPRMDGIALVTTLRARGVATPIIMLSGDDDPHLVVRAVRAGVNNYIPKPIHPAIFFEKIAQTLSQTMAAAS